MLCASSGHLGRTSVLTKYSDGYIRPDSLTRYAPFGAYRTGGRSPITDRAFTSQRENMALGLYYYNARYYLPGVGRFLSADTIVPDPQNPQQFNRYAYSLNSPLNYSDPSGHVATSCGDSVGSECGFSGNTWLGEWLGWNVVGDMAIMATGVTASASFDTPIVQIEGNVGTEWVWDTDNGQIVQFIIVGRGMNIGPNSGGFTWPLSDPDIKPLPINSSVATYIAGIHNVDNVLEEYSGETLYSTNTVAFEQGVMWGESYSRNDPKRVESYSEIAGYVPAGMSATHNVGKSYYFPYRVYDLQAGTISHPYTTWPEHLQRMTNWLLTLGE